MAETSGTACEAARVPDIVIRPMTIDDYDDVFALWEHIQGFALRSLDDTREYVARFLERNPKTSVVALVNGVIAGSILCGHDGRQASFYHVCVAESYRRHGLGRAMVKAALQALALEGISKVQLVAFDSNEGGNAFWRSIGWTPRVDLNSYEFVLNTENIVRYVE